LGPRALISIRTLPSAWLLRFIVTSCSLRIPRITPLPRSSEVIRTPSSCAADTAALQERSNVLGAGTGTGSYVVQPANTARMQIKTTVMDLRLRALSTQTQSDFIVFHQNRGLSFGRPPAASTCLNFASVCRRAIFGQQRRSTLRQDFVARHRVSKSLSLCAPGRV